MYFIRSNTIYIYVYISYGCMYIIPYEWPSEHFFFMKIDFYHNIIWKEKTILFIIIIFCTSLCKSTQKTTMNALQINRNFIGNRLFLVFVNKKIVADLLAATSIQNINLYGNWNKLKWTIFTIYEQMKYFISVWNVPKYTVQEMVKTISTFFKFFMKQWISCYFDLKII